MLHEFAIVRAESQSDLDTVRRLWREYWISLGFSEDFQDFGKELEALPGAYAPPHGAILVARSGNEPGGTIALRPLTSTAGEVKRLYLRPEYRGLGLGRRLLSAVMDRAAKIGYESLYADTLPSMVEALGLYERTGFVRTHAYSDHPTPGAIYLTLKVVRGSDPVPEPAL